MAGSAPSDLPLTCVCGESFTVAHSLTCLKGGFVTLCHNDIHDLSASLLKEVWLVCPNICREPILQPLTGESLQLWSASTDDGARLDISAQGFWGHCYQLFFLRGILMSESSVPFHLPVAHSPCWPAIGP